MNNASYLSMLCIKRIKFHLITFFCFFAIALSAATQTTLPDTLIRTVRWRYDGYTFTTNLKLSSSDYKYYHGLSKLEPYSTYATDNTSHEYLVSLAAQLDVDAQKLGYSNSSLVEYLVAFVQQAIPYKKDPYNNGHDYPKYPIETIIEKGGDCEDKSALLASLLNTFGFDAVMVGLPKHMAVALWSDRKGAYYLHDGKHYSFIETTSIWKIGSIPSNFKKTKASIIEVPKPKKYVRDEDVALMEMNSENAWVENCFISEFIPPPILMVFEPTVSPRSDKSLLRAIC